MNLGRERMVTEYKSETLFPTYNRFLLLLAFTEWLNKILERNQRNTFSAKPISGAEFPFKWNQNSQSTGLEMVIKSPYQWALRSASQFDREIYCTHKLPSTDYFRQREGLWGKVLSWSNTTQFYVYRIKAIETGAKLFHKKNTTTFTDVIEIQQSGYVMM